MNLKLKTLLTASVIASFGAVSQAAIEAQDDFSTEGTLVGTTPDVGGNWAAHSGAAAVPVTVTGGTITLAQGSGSREDVNIGFANGAMGAGDKYFAAFDLTVADPGATITSVYFAHFLDGTSNFVSRIWMAAPTTSGYRIGFSNDSSISDADGEVFTDDLAFGVTYRIVTSYDYDSGSGTIWINPTDESSPSLTATDPGFSNTVESYAFRQAGGNTTQVIDNLIVATTFAEVAGSVIPEPATLGLLALGGLTMFSRRSRKA